MTLEVMKTYTNVSKFRSSRVHTMAGNDVLISESCSSCGKNSTEIRKEYKKSGVRFG